MKITSSVDGFTVVELLAAMIVSSLVVLLVYSMYLFADKLMNAWEKRNALDSVVNQCTQTISMDAMNSAAPYSNSDSALILGSGSGDTISYKLSQNNVWRDGVSFLPSDSSGYEVAGGAALRITAFIASSLDTATGLGLRVRQWYIRVNGGLGDLTDSSIVRTVSILSSSDLVRTDSAETPTQ